MTADRPAPGDHGPRVLAFVAPWCGPCHRLQPVLAEVAEGRDDGVRLVTVRVDEHPDQVGAHGVRATPTTIALHGDTEVARVVGAMGRAQVEQLFAAAGAAEPTVVRAGTPLDLVLRLAASVVLVLAGLQLDQPILLAAGVGLVVVSVVLALFRRRRTPTTPAVPGSRP